MYVYDGGVGGWFGKLVEYVKERAVKPDDEGKWQKY